jgi:hypothetical protein
MHSARKWVYWWHTIFNCVALTLVQIFGVWRMDLSTTVGIFQFSFLTAATELVVHTVGGIYGYWDEGRKLAAAATPANSVSPDAQEVCP